MRTQSKKCEECGSPVARSRNRFCSGECARAYRQEESITSVRCARCGIEFMRHKCHAKAVNQFCSRECHGAWNSKNKALENHPRWLGGEGTEVLRTCNGVLRRWVKVGDGRFVQNYRVVLEKAGVCVPRGHVVHHRDGNQLNDALGNLEVLTRKEHLERHPEIMEAAWEMSRGK